MTNQDFLSPPLIKLPSTSPTCTFSIPLFRPRKVSVRFCKFMSTETMRQKVAPKTPSSVLGVSNDFQVGGIHAMSNPAEMIQFEALRNRTNQQKIANSMSWHRMFINIHLAVAAFIQRASPQPASPESGQHKRARNILIHFGVETFQRCVADFFARCTTGGASRSQAPIVSAAQATALLSVGAVRDSTLILHREPILSGVMQRGVGTSPLPSILTGVRHD